MPKLNKMILTALLALAIAPQGFVYAQFYTNLNNPQTNILTDPNSYIIAFALSIIIFFIAFYITLKS
jgi:hypothetical protein